MVLLSAVYDCDIPWSYSLFRSQTGLGLWCLYVDLWPSQSNHHTEVVHAKYETNILTNRGSYMSAHVFLNLLNKLGKRDKMQGLSSILSLFHN